MSSNGDAPSPLTPAKARLTDAEKRQNHINSEKKRRDAIRAGFDKICDIVPEMQGQGRSEAVVLQATVAFMREQLQKKERLRQHALDKGWSEADFNAVYTRAEDNVRALREEEAAKQRAAEGAESGQ